MGVRGEAIPEAESFFVFERATSGMGKICPILYSVQTIQ